MILFAPDATTMSVGMGDSQMGALSLAFSLGDASFPLDLDSAGLVVNRNDALFAKYWHTAFGGQGVSIADTWGASEHTLSSGTVVAYKPFQEILQEYRHRIGDEIRLAYRHRIADLREYGAEEGVAIKAASERDFWAFIGIMPSAREAGVVLTPDGDLRAIWDDDNDDDSHFAVQFLGGGQVQYVVFRRRPTARRVSRAAGTDTLSGVKRQIIAFDLGRLVYL